MNMIYDLKKKRYIRPHGVKSTQSVMVCQARNYNEKGFISGFSIRTVYLTHILITLKIIYNVLLHIVCVCTRQPTCYSFRPCCLWCVRKMALKSTQTSSSWPCQTTQCSWHWSRVRPGNHILYVCVSHIY